MKISMPFSRDLVRGGEFALFVAFLLGVWFSNGNLILTVPALTAGLVFAAFAIRSVSVSKQGQIGLFVAALATSIVVGTVPKALGSDPRPICDRFAADPFALPNRNDGVVIINPDIVKEAERVCGKAKSMDSKPQYSHQWARAIQCDGDFKTALNEYESLARDRSYAPAAARAAETLMLIDGRGSEVTGYIQQVSKLDGNLGSYLSAVKLAIENPQDRGPVAEAFRKRLREEVCAAAWTPKD